MLVEFIMRFIGGAGGSGKTRLAYELPNHLFSDYELMYLFIDGRRCKSIETTVSKGEEGQIINLKGEAAYKYTSSLLLSLLVPQKDLSGVDISFSALVSKILKDCFSSNSGKVKVLYIHIDECQLIPSECRAILRTIREFTKKGKMPFVVIPVLSGISSLDIKARDLVEVSGMQPYNISLAGMEHRH